MKITEDLQKDIIKLYVKDRLSMKQIGDKFNLSSSAIRYYLDKYKIKRRTISDAITSIYITRFKKKPFKLKEGLSKAEMELKIAGIMLYWGEGAKSGGTVKFANSDPEMIKVFLKFLRNICGIFEERLKVLIHMYPDQDEKTLIKFWSFVTKIKKENFYKSYTHEGKKGTYKNKSLYGTLAVHYSDKKLLNLILNWLDFYKTKFIIHNKPS